MAMPRTEVVNTTRRNSSLKGKIMNSVWDILSFKCLWYTQMDMPSRQADGWYLFAIVVDGTSTGDTVLWEDSQGSDGINEKGFSTISTVQLPQMSSSFSYF